MPFFADYAPEAHGTPDPRLVVRAAVARDIPELAAVARTRGPQPVTFDERLAQWVADDERRVAVAVLPRRAGAHLIEGQEHHEVAESDLAGGPDALDPSEPGLVAASVVAGWAMVARRHGHRDAPDGRYVSWLVVDPSWRRRGVARRLVTDVLGWATTGGEVLYSLVNEQNRASLDLHEALGFREVARSDRFGDVTFRGGAGLLLEARTP